MPVRTTALPMLADTLSLIFPIPLVDMGLTFYLYKIQTTWKKSFQYEIDHKYFAIRSDMHYISLPSDGNVLSSIVSTGHFCG